MPFLLILVRSEITWPHTRNWTLINNWMFRIVDCWDPKLRKYRNPVFCFCYYAIWVQKRMGWCHMIWSRRQKLSQVYTKSNLICQRILLWFLSFKHIRVLLEWLYMMQHFLYWSEFVPGKILLHNSRESNKTDLSMRGTNPYPGVTLMLKQCKNE